MSEQQSQPTDRQQNGEHCMYRGDKSGLRQYPNRPNIFQQLYSCAHPRHVEATADECSQCHDFRVHPDAVPRLHTIEPSNQVQSAKSNKQAKSAKPAKPKLPPRGKVTRWSIGVTTAPRDGQTESPTLARTLASLEAAGFGASSIQVFRDDPPEQRGIWQTWYLTLAELTLRDPQADAFMIVQDDVVFSQGVRKYLEASLWPTSPAGDDLGFVSLYTPTGYDRTGGFFPVRRGASLWSACAWVFPLDAAIALLMDKEVQDWRIHGINGGTRNVEAAVGGWAERTGREVFYHTPSLAQHIGDVSTYSTSAKAVGCRQAVSFRGEDFDARSLIRKPGEKSRDLTVIVPSWNCGKYLAACVESLRSQTQPPAIMVVDDGSDDDTQQVLAGLVGSYSGTLPRFEVRRHSCRQGANAARNTGLAGCDTEYVAFCDADATYKPNWAKELLDVITIDDNCAVAYSDFTRVVIEPADKERGKSAKTHKHSVKSRSWDIQQLWWGNYIAMPSVVRRAALPSKGLTETGQCFDDWRLWLTFASNGWTGKHVSSDLYEVIERPEGKTAEAKRDPANLAYQTARVRRDFAWLVGIDEPILAVIPAVGSPGLTIRCLTHLAAYSGVPVDVCYVDNGSTAEDYRQVADYAAANYPWKFTPIRNAENLGFTEATNQGMRLAAAGAVDSNGHHGQPYHVLLLNNDCFVAPGCVEAMLWDLVHGKKIGAVGPLSNDDGHQSLKRQGRLKAAGLGWDVLDLLNEEIEVSKRLAKHRHSYVPLSMAAFFCTLIHRDAAAEIGELSNDYPSGLGADDEWCYRAKQAGWNVVIAMDAYAMHMHKTTFKRLGLDREGMGAEAMAIYRAMVETDQREKMEAKNGSKASAGTEAVTTNG